jgi:hypothetical protein
MTFALVCIGMIVGLGIFAWIANHFDKGSDTIETGHDCSTCTAAQEGDCKIHCLLEEKRQKDAASHNKSTSKEVI